MKRKVLAGVLAIVLACGMVSGCGKNSDVDKANSGGDSGEKVTVKFFNGNVEMVDWYNEAVDRFNQQSDTIKVEHEFQKEGTAALQTKIAADDIPDITTMSSQQMIDAGKFLDLSDSEWWDRIDPSIKELSKDTKSGKNYYIPSNTMITAAIYNQKIFDELKLTPANTLDEFTDNLRAVKKARPDMDPLYFSGKEAWTIGMLFGCIPEAVERQKIGDLEYGKAALEGDLSVLKYSEKDGALEKYMDWLGTLQEEGLINDNVLTATYDDAMNAIAKGEAAVIFQGLFALGGIIDINPEAVNELRVSAMPAVSADVKPAINQSPDSTYYIMADSPNQEAAKEFLTWLFSVENQVSYTETRNAPSAFEDVSADLGPIVESAVEVSKSAASLGPAKEPAGFGGDASGVMLQEFFAGQYTPEEFAAAYEKAWKTAFDAQ